MKNFKIYIGILLCLFLGEVKAQDREVIFEDLYFKEALAKAKEQNKPLFLDAYTSWCGPCKMMLNTVFKENTVADFMNSHFICIKIDMEKGEGPALRNQFNINAFPTYILFDGEGNLQHRMVGASDGVNFMKKLEEGLNPETSLAGFHKRYESGERGKEFLMKYIRLLQGASEHAKLATIGRAYLETLTDDERFTTESWRLYSDYYIAGGASGAPFQYIIDHKQRFVDIAGNDEVNDCLYGMFNSYVIGFLVGRPCPADVVDTWSKKIQSARLPEAQEKALMVMMEMGKAREGKDIDKMLNIFDKQLSLIPANEHYRLLLQLKYIAQEGTPKQKKKTVELLNKKINQKDAPAYVVTGLGEMVQKLNETKI